MGTKTHVFFNAQLKGIAAFVFGMNFIAILMKLNGSAVSGNLAWDFVFAFVKLELWIASIVVIIVICTLAFRHLENNEQDERLQPKESLTITANAAKSRQDDIQAEFSKAATAKESNVENSQLKHQESTAPPSQEEKQLSKEDVRKRVLQELTGRNAL